MSGIAAIGAKAPAFTLPDQDDHKVKLADFKGQWVVLYFYPKDDTPGCTTEACDFTDGLKSLEKLNAKVLGVSADTTESHRKFIAKFKLKITLLSDVDHAMMEKYGVWQLKKNYGKEYMGIVRTTYLIDPDGKVAHRLGESLRRRSRAKGHRKTGRTLEEVAVPCAFSFREPADLPDPPLCRSPRQRTFRSAPCSPASGLPAISSGIPMTACSIQSPSRVSTPSFIWPGQTLPRDAGLPRSSV